jgi:hypothetical protein
VGVNRCGVGEIQPYEADRQEVRYQGANFLENPPSHYVVYNSCTQGKWQQLDLHFRIHSPFAASCRIEHEIYFFIDRCGLLLASDSYKPSPRRCYNHSLHCREVDSYNGP